MKKSAIIIAALLVGASVRADEPAAPKLDYSVTTSFSYTTEYVFRGIKNTSDAFQPSVEVDSNNFDLGVWTSQPITGDQQNEIDIYGGYKYAVTKELSLQAVATYYWYPEFSRTRANAIDGARETFEPGVGATYTIAGFSPSVFYYHDFMLRSDTEQAALGYALPLADIGTELDFSVYAGTSSASDLTPDYPGPHVRESYNYYGADVSLPYKLAASTTLTLGGHYAGNADAMVGTPRNHGWFSIAVTAGF